MFWAMFFWSRFGQQMYRIRVRPPPMEKAAANRVCPLPDVSLSVNAVNCIVQILCTLMLSRFAPQMYRTTTSRRELPK